VDASHQVVRQLSGPVLGLLGHVPRLTSQGTARAEHVEARGRGREQEPASADPALPSAAPLRGIRDVCKPFCELDQAFGKSIDVSHLKTPLSQLKRAFQIVPSRRHSKRSGTFRALR
jgi:hypothetical protein